MNVGLFLAVAIVMVATKATPYPNQGKNEDANSGPDVILPLKNPTTGGSPDLPQNIPGETSTNTSTNCIPTNLPEGIPNNPNCVPIIPKGNGKL